MVSSRKELATVLGQSKEEGEMPEDIQGLFYPFEGQNPSDLGDLFLPAFTPILKTLIRELWAADSFATFLIGLALATVPEEAFHHFQRLRDSLAKKRGQKGKGRGAVFAKITFYPDYPLPTPSAVKTVAPNFILPPTVRAEFFVGKMIIFSPFSVILDRDAKIVYDHPWLQGALEGVLCRITASNPGAVFKGFSPYRGYIRLNWLVFISQGRMIVNKF